MNYTRWGPLAKLTQVTCLTRLSEGRSYSEWLTNLFSDMAEMVLNVLNRK